MKIFRPFTLGLILIASTTLTAQKAKEWTLQQCVDYAFENNLMIERSEFSMENEEVTLKQNKLSRIPSLNANVYNSWRWGRSIDPTSNLFTTKRINSNGLGGSANFLLYNGSRITRSIKRSEQMVQAGFYDMEKAKNDVALNVVYAYLQVIFAREQLENANFQVVTSKAQLDQVEKKVTAGALPRTNLLDLKAQVATNEVDVITAENDVAVAVLNLKQFLQIPAEEAFDIETPNLEDANYGSIENSSGEIFKLAELTQPEIKSADLRIESAEMGIKIAQSAYVPSVTLQGQFGTSYSDQNLVPTGDTQTIINDPGEIGYLVNDPSQLVNGNPTTLEVPIREIPNIPNQWTDNRNWSVGFNISVPIFNGWQIRSNVQRARIDMKMAENNAKETRNALRQTIETAYNDAQAAVKVYDAAQRQVEALEESFRATEHSYNLGAVNSVDYQLASFNLFSAKSNLSRSKFDYIFRLKVLDFYLGKPLTL